MVARPSSEELPMINSQYTAGAYYNDASTDVTVATDAWSIITLDGGAFQLMSTAATSFNPYHQMGVFMTGLSAQTTFTITTWAYIECFPEQVSNVLTPLAQPSAPYDEQALRLYSEIIKGMPIAVMLEENGFGDWLADLAGKAVNVVSGIAGTVGRAANAVMAGADSWNRSGSDSLRGDGVARQIREEKQEVRKAAVKAVARSVAKTVPKASAALRQQMAMDKIRAKGKARR
jgi:hypothetical protein